MSDHSTYSCFLTTVFVEMALALGGVVNSYQVPDDAIWVLARSMDAVHRRALTKLDCSTTNTPTRLKSEADIEHPAIVFLLQQLDQSVSGAERTTGEE